MKYPAKKLEKIYDIWQENSIHGNFLRHIDGRRQHNSIYNLALIHPYDAFTHLDWVVNWDSHLTPAQVKFVREHIGFFVNRYNQERFETSLKGNAKICNPNMQSEIVPVEEADKYKEFIAKTWNEICEHSPEMRNAPNEHRYVDLE